jgi:hypothetical protein
MRPTPERDYEVPSYPTRTGAAAEPDLLGSHLPEGWQRGGVPRPLVVFLLALNAAACAAPGNQPAAPAQPRPGTAVMVPTPGEAPAPAESATALGPLPAPTQMLVAPLFDHGEGRGATGCVVVSPPIFLSEEEAMTVIREQLARHGVELRQEHVAFGEVVVPDLQLELGGERPALVEGPASGKALEVDALDPERHVAVEFVSVQDYEKLTSPGRSYSSVQLFEIRPLAAALLERVRKTGQHPVYFGMFYDPVMQDAELPDGPPSDAAWEALVARQTARAKALLQAQVEDFVAWLDRQGVR